MRSKILTAAVAGGLLVGAGLVTSVVSSAGVALAQEDGAGTETHGFFERGLDFLADVLADLVADDTIDQNQADTILAATEDKAAELKAEREELRALTRSLLEDGVLTEEEAAQLPDDHPFFDDRFDAAWEDGELTSAEIREIMPHPRRDAFKRGARFGALLDDGGIDQSEYDELIARLPADHPLVGFDASDYLSDGLITPEELREILGEIGRPLFDHGDGAAADLAATSTSA